MASRSEILCSSRYVEPFCVFMIGAACGACSAIYALACPSFRKRARERRMGSGLRACPCLICGVFADVGSVKLEAKYEGIKDAVCYKRCVPSRFCL